MLTSRRLTAQTNGQGRSCNAVVSRSPVSTKAIGSRVAVAGWEDSRRTTIRLQESVPQGCTSGAPRRKPTTMMGNKAVGGPFSPLVVVTRNIVGEKEFNKFRGKAISLHSQVIKEFCKLLGVDNKQVQGVIRLAKKEWREAGFLGMSHVEL